MSIPNTSRVKEENGKLICTANNCGKEFSSAMLLLVHQFETNHLGIQCSLCNKTFCSSPVLRRHVKSVHLNEQHLCIMCTKKRTFNRLDNLYKHQLKCHGMVQCDKCGAGFNETKWLKEHAAKHHPV